VDKEQLAPILTHDGSSIGPMRQVGLPLFGAGLARVVIGDHTVSIVSLR
jgi:hypothetical protein